jgi:hypothetical protein
MHLAEYYVAVKTLHENPDVKVVLLQIPVARSHLIKYAAINKLIEESENRTASKKS